MIEDLNICDVVHIVTPHLNGALYDAFEYFHYFFSKNNNNKLFLVQCKNFKSKKYMDKDYIIELYKDKYDIDESVFDNVVFLNSHLQIMNYRFDNVLILDNHTYHYLDGLLVSNQYYFIVDPYLPSKTDYKKINDRKNHNVYCELMLYEEEINGNIDSQLF